MGLTSIERTVAVQVSRGLSTVGGRVYSTTTHRALRRGTRAVLGELRLCLQVWFVGQSFTEVGGLCAFGSVDSQVASGLTTPSLYRRLIAGHSALWADIDQRGRRWSKVCRSRYRTIVLAWCRGRMRDLQLRAQRVRLSQCIGGRKSYIRVGLINLSGRYISHPGHGFRSAVMSRSHRSRCVAGANRRRSAFLRADVGRGVHSARYKRIAQSLCLRLSRNSQTAGYNQSNSSGFEAFDRHLLGRIASGQGCFHWSFELLLCLSFPTGFGFQGFGATGHTGSGYSNLRLMYENPPLSVVGGLTHSDAVSPTQGALSAEKVENRPIYRNKR